MEHEQTRTAVCVAGSPGRPGLSQYLLWVVEALCACGEAFGVHRGAARMQKEP